MPTIYLSPYETVYPYSMNILPQKAFFILGFLKKEQY